MGQSKSAFRLSKNNHVVLSSLILTIGVPTAIYLRFIHFSYVTYDIQRWFGHWFHALKYEGLETLKTFCCYTPPYHYLLWIAGKLFPTIYDVALIKSIPSLFDFIAAYMVYRIVSLRWKSPLIRTFSFLCVLFCPTVILTSAMWGQIDMIWISFVLGFIYYSLRNQPTIAMASYAIAFSIKLQPIFIFPLITILLFSKFIKIRTLLIIPITMLATYIPAAFFGYPISKYIGVYPSQTAYHRYISWNVPNYYQWFIPSDWTEPWFWTGLSISALFFGTIILIFILKRAPFNRALFLPLALLFAVSAPFFLPNMMVRYFLLADVISIIYGFFYPRLFFIPIIIITTSYASYYYSVPSPYLFSMPIGAIFILIAITVLLYHTFQVLRNQ